MSTEHERVDLDAGGAAIAARYFAPTGAVRGAILFMGAMGVQQSFYTPFAAWLASRGFHVATFDPRGLGDSRPSRMRNFDADIVMWAERDAGAALRLLAERAGSAPITWVGHSFGGQIIPLVPGHERAVKVITIATGNGYWREGPPGLKHKSLFLWFGAVPVLTPIFGYFPGGKLGMVADLPRGVIRQWRRWCLDPEYVVGVEGPELRARFAAMRVPITSVSFTDDEILSAASIESMHRLYTGAPKTMRRYAPADAGVERIGHFAFFRAAQRPLWEKLVAPELS